MTKPSLIISDVHCHDWSQFSKIDEDGVNSRLRIILNETERHAAELISRGGDTMVIAGDLFHVRGSIKPSVMNPVMESFQRICDQGVQIAAIAGNHDLEGVNADKLGNAMQSLDAIAGFTAVTAPMRFQDYYLLPWYQSLDNLRSEIEKAKQNCDPSKTDLVIHAPVDGVILGIPDHGLTAKELGEFGFRRVFVGHYHNYRDFRNGVYSCGATTHQTWSDPGSIAGGIMVYDAGVEHLPTQAPLFVDIKDPDMLTEDVVSGNYIRMKLKDVTEAEIKSFRSEVIEMGARDVVIEAIKKKAGTRVSSIKSGASLEASCSEFIKSDLKPAREERVQAIVADILSEAS